MIFLSLLSLGCKPPVENTSSNDYILIWQEKFDGEAGARPNTDVWEMETGNDGWGNNQLEYNTNRSDNAQLTGTGELKIIAKMEEYGGSSYTSARIKTKDAFEPVFGRFEARIKLPAGQGLWPAFWLLGADFEEDGWPLCGEIDIMEFRGEEPDTVIATVHGPGYSGGAGVGTEYKLQEGAFSDGWHVFSVDIDPDHIAWYIDEQLVHTVAIGDLPPNTPWVLDNPMKIILNVAVGGNFVQAPNDPSVFPAEMYVDWVRFWERLE